MELTPSLVLAMWAGGISAGAAAVAWWQVVGPGYLWLNGALVAGFGAGAGLLGGGIPAWLGVGLALVAVVGARRRPVAAAALAAGAAAFVGSALLDSPWLPAVTGTVFLGGITAEMILGHWYLVDPRLPRWALHRLDVAAGAGLALELAALAGLGAFRWAPADAVIGWTLVALAILTAVLLVGVWFALRERAYSGVMAATGLSYLAVLTAFGVAVVGRALVSG